MYDGLDMEDRGAGGESIAAMRAQQQEGMGNHLYARQSAPSISDRHAPVLATTHEEGSRSGSARERSGLLSKFWPGPNSPPPTVTAASPSMPDTRGMVGAEDTGGGTIGRSLFNRGGADPGKPPTGNSQASSAFGLSFLGGLLSRSRTGSAAPGTGPGSSSMSDTPRESAYSNPNSDRPLVLSSNSPAAGGASDGAYLPVSAGTPDRQSFYRQPRRQNSDRTSSYRHSGHSCSGGGTTLSRSATGNTSRQSPANVFADDYGRSSHRNQMQQNHRRSLSFEPDATNGLLATGHRGSGGGPSRASAGDYGSIGPLSSYTPNYTNYAFDFETDGAANHHLDSDGTSSAEYYGAAGASRLQRHPIRTSFRNKYTATGVSPHASTPAAVAVAVGSDDEEAYNEDDVYGDEYGFGDTSYYGYQAAGGVSRQDSTAGVEVDSDDGSEHYRRNPHESYFTEIL